mmetsp:Transcript_28608/g.63466  ORF Transcript_28608/g.63466 Transcript_28608/m.63466 type:complete len:286 (-) Transcript_28608:267-1124(-)
MPCLTPWKMSLTPPIPSRWMGRSSRTRARVYSTISCMAFLFAPREPPIAQPKKSCWLIKEVDSSRRSWYTPPCTMPYRACVPVSVRRNCSSERRAHRCERRIESAVYVLSTLKGVHSSSTTMRSAPNCRWMSTDFSGVRWCMLPSTYERKVAPSSVIPSRVWFHPSCSESRFPLISDDTLPKPIENIWYPPLSVSIGPRQAVNSCRPPMFSTMSGPGVSMRWYVFDSMICVPSARSCAGLSAFMAAFVAQKTKLGVSTVPCGVVSRPTLALEVALFAPSSNEKFG